MPRKTGSCGTAVCHLCCVLSLVAAGATARANVVGNDIQNFNATTDGLDYVTVNASETLAPGVFNLGLIYNHAVNSLPYLDDAESKQNRLKYNDSLSTVEAHIGAGVTEHFSVGISIPRLMHQTVNGEGKRGQFSGPGYTHVRTGGKYRLFGNDGGGMALAGSVVFNRVHNNPYVGKGGSPIYTLEWIGDMSLADFSVALNLGYRYREKGKPVEGYEIQPMGNQYIGSAGISYLLTGIDTKLIVEIFGSRPANKTDTGLQARQGSSAELLGGVKFDYNTNLAFHVGGGTEMIHGVSSPDWRAYGGLNWTFAPDIKASKLFESRKDDAEERVILYNILFATGSDVVPASAIPRLEAVRDYLQQIGRWKRMIIEGHTDSVGSVEVNQNLSVRRATAVKNWLVQNLKVEPGRIEVVGFGESRPIADNGNFQGRQRNRRVEIRVIK